MKTSNGWLAVLLRYGRSSAMAPVAAAYLIFLLYGLFSKRPTNVCSGLLVTNSLLNGMILMPVAGVTVGSWIAIREFRSGVRAARSTAAGIGRFDGSVEVIAAMLWLLVVAGVGYVVAAIWTAAGGCDGQVNGLAVLVTAFGSVVSVAIGYWIGYALPYVMVPPVLIAVSFIFVSAITSTYGDFYTLWFPVTGATMSVFYSWKAGVFLAQLPLFLGLISVSIFGRALLTGRSRIAVSGIALSVIVASLGIAVLTPYKGRWENTKQVVAFAPYCVGSDPQVCVEPAFKRAAPLVANTFGPFMAKVRGTVLYAATVEQRPRSILGAATLPNAKAFHLDSGDADTVRGSAAEYVEDSLDQDSCYQTSADGEPRIATAAPYQTVILGWLLSNPVLTPGADATAFAWFAALTHTQQEAWFQAHAKQVVNCTLSASDFR